MNGAAAHGTAIAGNPVREGSRAVTANYAAVTTGQTADAVSTLVGVRVVKTFSIPEAEWSFSSVAGGITTTADTTISAAGAAGIKNYLTGCSVQNASVTISTEFVIKDGSTVIWRGYLGVGSLLNSAVGVSFANPLKGTAATAMNVAAVTTASQIYVNCQGYQAP